MDFNYRFLRSGGTAFVTPRPRVLHDQWREPVGARAALPRVHGRLVRIRHETSAAGRRGRGRMALVARVDGRGADADQRGAPQVGAAPPRLWMEAARPRRRDGKGAHTLVVNTHRARDMTGVEDARRSLVPSPCWRSKSGPSSQANSQACCRRHRPVDWTPTSTPSSSGAAPWMPIVWSRAVCRRQAAQ